MKIAIVPLGKLGTVGKVSRDEGRVQFPTEHEQEHIGK